MACIEEFKKRQKDEIIGDSSDKFSNDKIGRRTFVVDDGGNVDSVVVTTRASADNTTRYTIADVPLPLRRAVPFPDEEEPLPSWMPQSSEVDFGEAERFSSGSDGQGPIHYCERLVHLHKF